MVGSLPISLGRKGEKIKKDQPNLDIMMVKGKMLRGTYNVVTGSGTYITDQRWMASVAREALRWRHLASAAGLWTPPPRLW